MSQTRRHKKGRIRSWLHSVTSRSDETLSKLRDSNLMKRMSSINPRTHKSGIHIGRNDPCLCGNTYAGTIWRDKDGNPILDWQGKTQEIPVKFKECCMNKCTGLQPGEVTPALLKHIDKQKAYFKKHGRLA
jgi:hypothetical protein